MINFNRKTDCYPRGLRHKKKWRDFDFLLWGVPLIMVILSSFLIASTQRQLDDANWYLHSSTGVIGFLIAYLVAQSPIDRLRNYLIPIYCVTVLSLIAVAIFGTSAFGAQRWLSIGGVNVQPSEIAKLTSILVLAGVLDRYNLNKPIKLLKPLGVILLPWFLIFLQPDLGTSLVFGAVLLIMLYWAGMPLEWGILALSGIFSAIIYGVFKWLLLAWIPFTGFLAYRSLQKSKIFACVVMCIQVGISFLTPWLWSYGLKDYQRERLILFLDPGKDPLGGGYHLLQSQIGIGSGGLWGTGLLQGQLTKLHFIPEQHTDFIFSALGEEMGFIGTAFLLSAFFFLIVRLLKVARNARTDFEALVVIGIVGMLMFQVIVNIFMTIGLGPVTGIPLPFMSYGRTALMVNFISIGLCISVSRRTRTMSKGL